MHVALDGDLAPVAAAVLEGLGPGDAVHLSGPLGAGKTALVRACAERLGASDPVTSPTFALAHRYGGPQPIAHLDLYRLAEQPQRDVAELLDELRPDAIAFVEWPQMGVGWLPAPTRTVRIAIEPDGARRFVLSAPGDGAGF